MQGEVDYVKSLGVDVRLNSVIGKIDTVDELLSDGYDAVIRRKTDNDSCRG